MDRANRIKEIIEYKKRRLDELADPNEWERITKNMECGEYKEFKQHCIDEEIIIDALREQEQSKWISVKERLPEEDTRVLVYLNIKKLDAYTHTIFDTDRMLNGKWIRWNGYITHWMPLPEPPEEGAD